MAVATVLGFPGAGFGLGTFGVAVLPALALMTVLSLIGVPRRKPFKSAPVMDNALIVAGQLQ
jgi:hypothetical protein